MRLGDTLIGIVKLSVALNGVDKTAQFLSGLLVDLCREEKSQGYRVVFPFGETVEVLTNDHVEEIPQ